MEGGGCEGVCTPHSSGEPVGTADPSRFCIIRIYNNPVGGTYLYGSKVLTVEWD